MAIGSVGSGSAYTIGGKPLGVQLGGKSASSMFGGGQSANSLIAINVVASGSAGPQVDAQQMILKGIQDDIDRTLGYRTDLSVVEKQKLADLQTEIQQYNTTAQARSLTSDEISERADLYVEAYGILGKDYVDVASDEYLTSKTEELTELMTTVPKGADAEQLALLEKLQTKLQDRVDELGDTGVDIYYDQLRSIAARIQTLTPPRNISDLSPAELKQHDEIADAINEYAGQELQIKSDKRLKIERLQRTMQLIQEGGVNAII